MKLINTVHLYFKFFLIYFGIGLLLSATLFAQNRIIDSLVSLAQNEKNDTVKVSILNNLSKELRMYGDLDRSLDYAEKSIKLSDDLNFKYGKAYALKWAGVVYYDRGEFISVLDLWSESLKNFEAIGDTIGMANIIGNIGAVYQSKGSYEKALEYYLQSLSFAEKLNDSLRIATNLYNLGGMYGEIEKYDKALNYFNEMEVYFKNLDDPALKSSYMIGMGETYFNLKDYEKALKYYEDAMHIKNYTLDLTHILTMLGKVEFNLSNKESAVLFLNRAYNRAKENNQKPEIITTLLELGNVYQKSNQNKALEFYKEAMVYAKEIKVNSDLRDVYEGIFKTYSIKGDFKNAFAYQSQYIILKDSIFNLEIAKIISDLEFGFDLVKKDVEIDVLQKEIVIGELKSKRQKIMNIASASAAGLILLLAISYYRRFRFSKKTNLIIEEEKNRSQKLLLNILPKKTAVELINKGKVQAKKFELVSVMFTDFKDFTSYSTNLSPDELVSSVDFYYSKFDEIIEKYGLEKIKTIGDSYMCAGGLPFPTEDHSERIILAAFEIIEFMENSKEIKDKQISHFDIRIGINSGPVVAGVVGRTKFAYDIWGDTVNVASRMESNSEPGMINISENTYALIKDQFDCEYRGKIKVKNRGIMKMYFVKSVKKKKIKGIYREGELII